jgi:hypothetical protein
LVFEKDTIFAEIDVNWFAVELFFKAEEVAFVWNCCDLSRFAIGVEKTGYIVRADFCFKVYALSKCAILSLFMKRLCCAVACNPDNPAFALIGGGKPCHLSNFEGKFGEGVEMVVF